jgi:putative Mn2+ efflux pump MntP
VNIHHILFLIALLVPLSIDVFVLSTALGLAGLPKKDRLRTSIILSCFEAGMPAVGALIGHGIGGILGNYGGYVAAIVIGLAGLLMLRPAGEKKEERNVRLLSSARGLTIINLGLSISIDGLAIGLSLGLLHVPLLFVVVWIAIQTFLATRLGLWLGDRLSERLRESAERFGGIILVAIALVLIIVRSTGHQL